VDVRAEALGNLPFELYRAGAEEPLQDGEDALPFEVDGSLSDLFDQIVGDYTLYGAWYLHLERNRTRVLKVRRLHPSTVKPKYSPEDGLIGFERTIGSKTIDIPVEDMVYLWAPNRKAETGPGAAAAEAALKAAGMLNFIDRYGEGYFQRGAVRPLVIGAENVGGSSPDSERFEEWFKRAATGLTNAFRAFAVRGKLTFTTIGDSPGELALPELTDKKREDIATALGVPQTLLFSNAANYATAIQDDLHFYSKTVLPLATRIERALNRQLLDKFQLEMHFHPEQLELFQALESEKADKLTMLVGAGIIDKNEARTQLGYKPVEEGPVVPPSPTRPPAADDNSEEQADDGQPSARSAEFERALRQWQRKAQRRMSEGKPQKGTQFESDAIPDVLHQAIEGALEAIDDKAGVGVVFADALNWEGYP
jgi:HK97 family phage portal protein